MEQFGDAEVEQLGNAGGGDQNIARLHIAMDDVVLVRVLDGGTYNAKHLQPLDGVETVVVTVNVDGQALDIIHNEIRQTVVGRATIEQLGDVGMIEMSENLLLVAEAAKDGICVHTAFHQLDRHLLLEL